MCWRGPPFWWGMKTADVKIGQQYYATVSGGRVRVTVLGQTERFAHRVGCKVVVVVEFRCRNERTGREVFKSARQLTPVPERTAKQDMATIVAFVDGVLPSVTVVERLEPKPVVVGYTNDELGLPLVTTDCPAHGTLCADAHCGRRETPAERHARIYADAMNH